MATELCKKFASIHGDESLFYPLSVGDEICARGSVDFCGNTLIQISNDIINSFSYYTEPPYFGVSVDKLDMIDIYRNHNPVFLRVDNIIPKEEISEVLRIEYQTKGYDKCNQQKLEWNPYTPLDILYEFVKIQTVKKNDESFPFVLQNTAFSEDYLDKMAHTNDRNILNHLTNNKKLSHNTALYILNEKNIPNILSHKSLSLKEIKNALSKFPDNLDAYFFAAINPNSDEEIATAGYDLYKQIYRKSPELAEKSMFLDSIIDNSRYIKFSVNLMNEIIENPVYHTTSKMKLAQSHNFNMDMFNKLLPSVKSIPDSGYSHRDDRSYLFYYDLVRNDYVSSEILSIANSDGKFDDLVAHNLSASPEQISEIKEKNDPRLNCIISRRPIYEKYIRDNQRSIR